MVQTRTSAIEVTGASPLAKEKIATRNASSNGTKNASKRQRLPERTDPTRWRLRDEAGCQTWHYLDDDEEAKKWPQSLADKYFLGLPLVSSPPGECDFLQAVSLFCFFLLFFLGGGGWGWIWEMEDLLTRATGPSRPPQGHEPNGGGAQRPRLFREAAAAAW